MEKKVCPLQHTLELLGGKWKMAIIYQLSLVSPKRFKELERSVIGITPTMLTTQLKDLEANGLITRKPYATVPPTVEYSLTEIGFSIIPLASQLREWGIKHMKDLGLEEAIDWGV
ncbi:hypothetical protein AD998_20985 [bacterium 336/3]|nr:hypothetical protein AD998_20985 [bacterium 336/3]